MIVHPDLPDPQTALLRRCAAVELDADQVEELARAAASLADWEGLAERAEAHGLEPLAYHHLREAKVSLPTRQALELLALTLRHRRSHEIRSRALREVLDACTQNNIEAVVLKGAVLSRLIYPKPEFRPMSDLDLLVPGEQAASAQQLLEGLGYWAPAQHRPTEHHHHHLPVARCEREGLQVSIEVHLDALHNDVPASIRFGNFSGPLREFDLCGRPAFALGHVDMLRHLCHNAFQPRAAEVKLVSVADIVGYATVFLDDIDWGSIEEHYPFVINTLRCLSYLAPLPHTLRRKIGRVEAPAPHGVGYGLKPLSQILNKGIPPNRVFRELFYPSDWWLHAYYGVAPGKRLWLTRWGRHPARVGRWLSRRLWASAAYRFDTRIRP
jgi:predicted nucleotidyltransferase